MKKEDIIFIEKPIRKSFTDLENQTFGRLKVIGFAGIYGKGKTNYSHWYVECTCGTIKAVSSRSLLTKCATSCGCYSKEVHSTHGLTGSSELSSFICAKGRCNNPKDKEYHNYGGRGIEFRLDSVLDVINDIGFKPEPKHQYSIERIDTNGHYEIGNLKWATMKEQQRNRRNNYIITINNISKCVSEWAEQYNISHERICGRINKLKWCEECAILIPTHKKGQIKQTCIHKVVSKK